jgi:hypothetical protein
VETVSQAGDRQTEVVVKTPTPHHVSSSSVPEHVQNDRKEEPVALGSQGQIAVAERSQQQTPEPLRQVESAPTAEVKTPTAPAAAESPKETAKTAAIPQSSSSLQTLLNTYQNNPKSLTVVAKVSETLESIDKRRSNPSLSPKLMEASNPAYLIVQNQENQNQHWLLPKAGLKVNQYEFETIEGLFDCQNYQNQPTQFQVQQPASVTRDGASWNVAEKGTIEFAKERSLSTESQLLKGVPVSSPTTAPAPQNLTSNIPGLDHSRTPNGDWAVTRQQETTNRSLMSEAQKALNRLAVSQPAGDRAYQGNGFSLSERGGVITVEVASTKTKVEQRGEVITGNAQPKDVQNFKEINARLAANRPHTAEKSQELEL